MEKLGTVETRENKDEWKTRGNKVKQRKTIATEENKAK